MGETINFSRRTFLSSVGASTLLSLVPNPVGGNAYANSEKLISDDWLALARKYGTPTGKFGKIGDPVFLNIGYLPYSSIFWVSTVNKQMQLLEKYLPRGSKVVWVKALAGSVFTKNLNTGKNQFGYMAETPALTVSDTVNCSCISVNSYSLGEVGGISLPKKYAENNEIKEPKDLDGKTIALAFGSFSHRQLLTFIKEHQIKPVLVNQTIDQQIFSLTNATVHAVVCGEPYASWLEERGVSKRWLFSKDMPNTSKFYYPDLKTNMFHITGVTLALHDWLSERPDVIRAYLKAEEECRDVLTHDPDLAAYFIWNDVPEIPPAVIRNVLNMLVWDGRITENIKKHFKACARMWKEEGFLKNPRSQNPDQYVEEWADNQMLHLAMKELEAEGFWTSNQLPGFPNPISPDQLQSHDLKKYKNIYLSVKPWKQTKI